MHTPGPWNIEYADGEIWGIYAADGSRIVETDAGVYPPREADARLIVAAPKMFKAIRYMAEHLCEHHNCYHKSNPEQCPFCEARTILHEVDP